MLEHHRYIIDDQVRYDVARRIEDEFAGSMHGVKSDIGRLCANPATAVAAVIP